MADLKILPASSVEPRDVKAEGAEKVKIRWLVSERDGAGHFVMRLFEIGSGGRTPLHAHDWEHEVYIIRGEGKLLFEGREVPFSEGHFAFLPGGAEHSFVNTGSGALEFLCMIPARG